VPHRLTIVGLGPGDPRWRSLAAEEALAAASRVILRTAIHPGLDDLVGRDGVSTCDDLYERAESFDTLYRLIVERVLAALDESDVVYAVPGSPTAGEATVRALSEAAAAAGHEVELVPSVGGLDAVALAAGLDLMADGVQVLDAVWLGAWVDRQPFNGSLLDVSPYRPVVVAQLYKPELAVATQVALSTLYPESHLVQLVRWEELSGAPSVEELWLFDLDRASVDHLTSLVVPPMTWRSATRSPYTLLETIALLRDERGCPWDRKQTHASLAPALVEEAFEVVDAIETGEPGDLADELGDLLLQPVMQAQIAAEAGEFDFGDVLDGINAKLTRRHPHVFGEATADTPEQVLSTWNAVKAGERNGLPVEEHPYAELPRSMPASRKLRLSLPATEGPLSHEEERALARQAAEAMMRLARAGADVDGLLDAACRILLDIPLPEPALEKT
jgi:tetrapyrrole methylase family protein/MazG family protein